MTTTTVSIHDTTATRADGIIASDNSLFVPSLSASSLLSFTSLLVRPFSCLSICSIHFSIHLLFDEPPSSPYPFLFYLSFSSRYSSSYLSFLPLLSLLFFFLLSFRLFYHSLYSLILSLHSFWNPSPFLPFSFPPFSSPLFPPLSPPPKDLIIIIISVCKPEHLLKANRMTSWRSRSRGG